MPGVPADEIVTTLLERIAARAVVTNNRAPQVPEAWPNAWLEQASVGIDELGQGFGFDPGGSLAYTGLRVPPLDSLNRYLFETFAIKLEGTRRIRIHGLRQLVTIGCTQTPSGGSPRLIELAVTSPLWRFTDGNISWHLMMVPPRNAQTLPQTNSDNFVFRYTETAPALVYESATFPAGDVNPFGRPDFYVSLTGYTPPNLGRPYGRPLLPTIHDLRWPWGQAASDSSLCLDVQGPGTVVLYASVLQTGGGSPLITGGTASASMIGMPEEAFNQNFFAHSDAGVFYWRVGGSILYEDIR